MTLPFSNIQLALLSFAAVLTLAIVFIVVRKHRQTEQMKEAVEFELEEMIDDYSKPFINSKRQGILGMILEAVFFALVFINPPILFWVIGLTVISVGGGFFVLGIKYKVSQSFVNLVCIDAQINTDTMSEPVYLDRFSEPLQVKIGKVFYESVKKSALEYAGHDSVLKSVANEYFKKNAKKYVNVLQSHEKPDKLITIVSNRPWDEVYRPGKDDKIISTTWVKVRVREAHMDLFYSGSHPVISSNKIWEKLGVDQIDMPTFLVMHPNAPNTNIADGVIAAAAYDHAIAASNREDVEKAKTDAMHWEQEAYDIDHDKHSRDAVKNKNTIAKTGTTPKEGKRFWKIQIKSWMWVPTVAAIFAVIGIAFGLWVAGG